MVDWGGRKVPSRGGRIVGRRTAFGQRRELWSWSLNKLYETIGLGIKDTCVRQFQSQCKWIVELYWLFYETIDYLVNRIDHIVDWSKNNRLLLPQIRRLFKNYGLFFREQDWFGILLISGMGVASYNSLVNEMRQLQKQPKRQLQKQPKRQRRRKTRSEKSYPTVINKKDFWKESGYMGRV